MGKESGEEVEVMKKGACLVMRKVGSEEGVPGRTSHCRMEPYGRRWDWASSLETPLSHSGRQAAPYPLSSGVFPTPFSPPTSCSIPRDLAEWRVHTPGPLKAQHRGERIQNQITFIRTC